MSRRSFDESVRRALDSLPTPIVAKLDNVTVVVEDPEEPDVFGMDEADLDERGYG
jgi:predicted Zn-dependent protease with MMP-like domain